MHCRRLDAVLAIQYMVSIAFFLGIRHAEEFHLLLNILAKHPSRPFQSYIDVLFASLKLGNILCRKVAFFPTLFFLQRQAFAHGLNLRQLGLNLSFLLLKEALSCSNLFYIQADLLSRDLILVKNPFFKIRAVAIIKPLNKLKETAQK